MFETLRRSQHTFKVSQSDAFTESSIGSPLAPGWSTWRVSPPSMLRHDKLKLLKNEEETFDSALSDLLRLNILAAFKKPLNCSPAVAAVIVYKLPATSHRRRSLNPGCRCRYRLLRGQTAGPDVLQLTEGCSATATGCSHFWGWCGTAGLALAVYDKDKLRLESRYGPDIPLSSELYSVYQKSVTHHVKKG